MTPRSLADQSYTDRAIDAVLSVVRQQHDFGGWLAEVVATAAAELAGA